MKENTGSLLIVDDDEDMRELVRVALTKHGFRIETSSSGDEALLLLDAKDFDVIVTDLRMPGISGVDFCDRVVKNRPDIPVIVITAFGSMDTAISAIRAGAYDFIPKPLETEHLRLTVERAIRHRHLSEEVGRLRRAVSDAQRFDSLIGSSSAMRKVFSIIERVAASDSSVLIQGESGSGKELVAQALHRASARAKQPFVAINCAAMPEALLESELFGHKKGAFTDAHRERKGLFAQAHNGTLFLDEIGDLPLALQPKLLRALQERTIRPVGGDREEPVDVRLVAATHRNLAGAVKEGDFREDLLFRLNVIDIDLPPLRKRGSDILLLAQHFLQLCSDRANKSIRKLSAPVADKLLTYAWPGNVRELQNCMERAVAFAQHDEITLDDLPTTIANYQSTQIILSTEDPAELVSLEEIERRYISRVIVAVNGNKSTTARILGVDRKTLYRKLSLYEIEVNDASE